MNSQVDKPGDDEREQAAALQAGALDSLASDFAVWKHKGSAIRVLQLKSDGPFGRGRQWYKQFFQDDESAAATRQAVNGIAHIDDLERPDEDSRRIESELNLQP